MSLRVLNNVSCGLALGLIFNVSYSYVPQEGVKISILFVSNDGNYPKINLSPPIKTDIQIGAAFFSMYPVSFEIQKENGRRIMKVDFVDETFKLDNFLIVLTGRGCGVGTYELGQPVDNRTPEQKQADALDKDSQTIRNFTQFDDLEYGFNDFLNVLRLQFNVQVDSAFDITFTKSYIGTFREVLNSWCSFYNLSFFFENSILKIFDPTKLSITLPDEPSDCLGYNYFETLEGTYDKTAFAYFQKDGGQFNVNESADGGGTKTVITNAALYPVGGEVNLKATQTILDLNQVVAAQYGKEFWFLYNYYNGTAGTECGWETINFGDISNVNLQFTISALLSSDGRGPANLAKLNTRVFDQKYEAYFNYGQKIAGKYYISDLRFDLLTDSLFQWFNVTNVSITNFTSDFAKDYQLKIDYLPGNKSGLTDTAVVENTAINDYFDGVKYYGDRMVFADNNFNPAGNLPPLDPNLLSYMTNVFKRMFNGLEGTQSLDTSSLGTENYVVYFNTTFNDFNPSVTDGVVKIFNSVSDLANIFKPRYTKINLAGTNKQDLAKLKIIQKEGDQNKIINNNSGSITGNTGIIRAINNGNQVVYYDKFSKCASASSISSGMPFSRRFSQQNISYDIPVVFSYQNLSNNTYKINRDLTNVNAIINSNLLRTIAQGRNFTTKRVTMTFNYFYDVPINFLTNGLVSLDLEINDNGITSSYVFSNEMLQIPYLDRGGNVSEIFIEKLEANMKNSWIRTYSPSQVISTN